VNLSLHRAMSRYADMIGSTETVSEVSVRELQMKFPLERMASSGMLRRVALVRSDVSEELSTSFIRVTRIGEL
jgi:hypothetical protein